MRSFVYIATVGLCPLFNEVLGTLTPGPTSKLYFGIYNLSLNEIVGPGLKFELGQLLSRLIPQEPTERLFLS